MATNTTVIELQPVLPEPAVTKSPKTQSPLQDQPNGSLPEPQEILETEDPENAVEALTRWNKPRINTYRLATIFFAFINFGMNDASYGALLPYVRFSSPTAPALHTSSHLHVFDS